ncbi:hypothetical protein CRE_08119 [Caenorhabditis remanei]|uniref:Uncharacterized protein n=1 Tax=Caenorhabditis remanei TaxID=31234 RepID=E3M3H7_CAERE|nr:hypothetical protein CRE_08119 [Caenorhabditis remanei]
MPTPKFMEGPNTVQTSLYGYDKNKKVQVNSLRGKPILVLRRENGDAKQEKSSSFIGGVSRFTKKWVDRSKQMPAPIPSKPMYPSYTHFHHQYSSTKPPPVTPLSLPSSPVATKSPTSFTQTAHDRGSSRRPPFSPLLRIAVPSSPKMTPEDEMTVKRLFDKLEVTTPPPSSNCSLANVTSEITLLELNPKIAAKSFITTPISVTSSSETETTFSSSSVDSDDISFFSDTPKSLSDSGRASCSENVSKVVEEEDCESNYSLKMKPEVKKSGHTCPDETQCFVFRNGVCPDEETERKNMIEWYNELIQWRHEIVTKKCFGPPRCHPPPLTVTIIGASRAQRANPFHRVGEVHPFAMEAMDHVRKRMDAKKPYRLVPSDLPLPAPHEFMANAKCMEPHLFIEYCYQLTAAAYMDTGLNPPNRRPPIPPRIEPIPEQACRESVCSSASEISSDGEYSDDSENTKRERMRQKMERHRRRERRLQRIFRRHALDEIEEGEDDD